MIWLTIQWPQPVINIFYMSYFTWRTWHHVIDISISHYVMITIDEKLHNHFDMVIMGLNRCAFMDAISISIGWVSIRLRCFEIQRIIMVNVIMIPIQKYLSHIEPRWTRKHFYTLNIGYYMSFSTFKVALGDFHLRFRSVRMNIHRTSRIPSRNDFCISIAI